LTYAWVPINDRSVIKRLCGSLHPGRSIVFEAALFDAGAPVGAHRNELLKVFQNDLRILRYEALEAVSDWDNRKKEQIVRMLAGNWMPDDKNVMPRLRSLDPGPRTGNS